MVLKIFKNILFIIPACILFLNASGYSQTDTTIKIIDKEIDSTKLSSKVELVRKLGENAIKQVIFENTEKQIHSRQLILLDGLDKELNKVNEIFKRGIDTVSINKEIKQIEEQFKIAIEGTGKEEIDIQTLRNLNTSTILVNEIETRLIQNKKRTESLLSELTPLKKTIDSLQTDTMLYKFPKDTALFKEYLERLNKTVKYMGPVDSNLISSIKSLRESENRMSALDENIKTSLKLIDGYKEYVINNIFARETNNIYVPDESNETIDEKINFSYNKGVLVLSYYLKNNTGKVIFVIFLFSVLTYFILRIKKQYYPDNKSELTEKAKLIFDHPVLSSVFFSLMIAQFIFPNPPVVFSGLTWIISFIILTFILWKFLSGKELLHWLFLFVIFILTLTLDLMLKVSVAERLLMFFIAISGIAALISAYKNNVGSIKKKNVKLILFLIEFALISGFIISNFFGRYNISKVFITVSVFALLTAILLKWTADLLLELLNASAEVSKSEGNENFQIKLQKFRLRFPVYLKFILFVEWIILVARNLYFFDVLQAEFISYINQENVIGDFSFTLADLMLFLFIIFISTLISKAISFYADMMDNSGKTGFRDSEKSGGLSNWMLLIRIGVITAGILLAFAASGVPLDKMTIIIGSLGVGIGLGLQSIVSNLVSGIMLAFEKPFKIGDYIEVDKEAGRIKEIGIRSSKLSTSEGAVIIIPNGDLLSKHVVNWTLRNSQKRSELILKIKYGDKLNEIRNVFQNIMDINENIEKYPKPEVLMHQFSGSSAEYRLLYWTYIDQEDLVKSELIVAVEDELKKAGVEMSS